MKDAMREIIITRSMTPVLRAGFGVVLLPIGVGFCILGYKAVLDITSSASTAWIVTLPIAVVFAYSFYCTVARVREKDGSIEIVRSLDRLLLTQNEILKSRVFAVRVNRSITVLIRVNGRALPIFLHCVVLDTSNVGGFRATVSAFHEIFPRER